LRDFVAVPLLDLLDLLAVVRFFALEAFLALDFFGAAFFAADFLAPDFLLLDLRVGI
jgi:hypothetical protein